MQKTHEVAAAAERFNGKRLYKDVLGSLARFPSLNANYKKLVSVLGQDVADHVFLSVVRATFYIELVKFPKVDSTKFETRWGDRMTPNDPRTAKYDECLAMCERAMSDAVNAIINETARDAITLFTKDAIMAYEIPFDYVKRVTSSPIHRADNTAWFWDDELIRTAQLRRFLTDPQRNKYVKVFSEVYDKIQVKAYLTDRALTGDYKTNREKRWEAHPLSPQFALRRECLQIEFTLINQLCHFDGFPADLFTEMRSAALVTESETYRCPITLDVLSFEKFAQEVRDPTAGKASFQVGHLNPLKAINEDPNAGHNAKNIAWVSEDGNRIQGSLSLDQTRGLLRRIRNNYALRGIG